MVEPGPANGQTRSYSDRERFVAFSFCSAEVILELDGERNISFAGGIIQLFTGKDDKALRGTPVLDIIAANDRPLAEQILDVAASGGRFDNIQLHLTGPSGDSQPLMVAGYRNPELDNRYFLSFHIVGGLSRDKSLKKVGQEGLYDAESFTKMATGLIKQGGAGADRMTLVEVEGLAEAEQHMDEAQRNNLLGAMGSVLKMSSATGDAAAKLGEGKYGLVHGASLDVDSVKDRISSLIANIAPEEAGLSVGAATIEAGDVDALSEENLAKGLVHTINEFSKSKGGLMSLHDLSGHMDDLVKEAVETAETFNRVVKNSDFRMAMHPIVGIADGRVHHYEALARFQGKHGESPFKYITFAEETGLISAFDLSVVDKVIAWLSERKDSGVSVAVNISGGSINDLRYVTGLGERLDANPWLKGMMIFELTESSEVMDLEGADEFIQKLRGWGYPVCLDDFGAGAASFNYLSAIDVDVVKLDGSAIKNAQAVDRGRAFLTALATFCRGLGVETIAEMVDTPEAVAFCRDCGIDYVQGFLFGKPSFDIEDFVDVKKHIDSAPPPGAPTAMESAAPQPAPAAPAAASAVVAARAAESD